MAGEAPLNSKKHEGSKLIMNAYAKARSVEFHPKAEEAKPPSVIDPNTPFPASIDPDEAAEFAAMEQVAREEEAGRLPILRFKQGQFLLGRGKEEVGIDTEMVFAVHETVTGHHRWNVGNEPKGIMERRLGRTADGFRPLRRSELSHYDTSEWRPGQEGEPEDPWREIRLVPVRRLSDGKTMLFEATSYGARQAVDDLRKGYLGSQHRAGSHPVVKLRHQMKDYGGGKRALAPLFQIVTWVPKDDHRDLSTKGAFLDRPAAPKQIGGPRNQPADIGDIPERIDRGFEDAIPF
jgi:hypothetical protein